jgi:hypothetical protein
MNTDAQSNAKTQKNKNARYDFRTGLWLAKTDILCGFITDITKMIVVLEGNLQ